MVAVAGEVVLGIRLRFNNHTPQQLAVFLAFHQQAADELGGDDLSAAGEEGLGESWEELGGYGCGCFSPFILLTTNQLLQPQWR